MNARKERKGKSLAKLFKLKKGNGGEYFIVFPLAESYRRKHDLPRGVGSVMCGTAWKPAAQIRHECLIAAIEAAIQSPRRDNGKRKGSR